MISWGWNSQKNTSNSEYGRGVAFAASQKASAFGGNSMISQMPAAPYFSIGQQGFTPGHTHSPTCPNFEAGQPYIQHNPTCANYSGGAGDQTQSYSGGGVYSTGGNSATDFDVLVGDAAINANLGTNTNAVTMPAITNVGNGEGNQQPEQPYQYNYNYYVPQKSNESETGAANIQNQPQQYNTGVGLGLPSGNDGVAKSPSNMKMVKSKTRKYAKPFPPTPNYGSKTQFLTTEQPLASSQSKLRLCGTCRKCRGLKDSGSSPMLFPSSTVVPPRRRNVNYIPNAKSGRNLAPTQLPSATPLLTTQQQQKSMSRRSSQSTMNFGLSSSGQNSFAT